MARKHSKRKHSKSKVVFLNPPKKHRRKKVRHNPSKKRRYKKVRHNPAFNPSPIARVRRAIRRNPGQGSVSVGSSIVDGMISVTVGGVGYFAGLMANKFIPASMIRFRGGIVAVVALLGIWKIKNKHARIGLIGLGIEGATDMLKQNLPMFTGLAADDASETIMGISTQRGNPALGSSDSLMGAGDGFSDELSGEEDYVGLDHGTGLGNDW